MLTVLVFMTLIGSTAAIAGIFVTVPTIPRTRISNNRPDSNPLKDSVRVGCELMDSIWTFKANATISGTCPGFNVRNKIRWDWANTKMSSVMSNDQTDGDGRALFRRIIVTGHPRTWINTEMSLGIELRSRTYTEHKWAAGCGTSFY